MAEPVRPAGDEREKGQDRRPSPTRDPARPATYLVRVLSSPENEARSLATPAPPARSTQPKGQC